MMITSIALDENSATTTEQTIPYTDNGPVIDEYNMKY